MKNKYETHIELIQNEREQLYSKYYKCKEDLKVVKEELENDKNQLAKGDELKLRNMKNKINNSTRLNDELKLTIEKMEADLKWYQQ